MTHRKKNNSRPPNIVYSVAKTKTKTNQTKNKHRLTRATSLSVLGESSPGNLIIGEGAAYVACRAMKCTKNALTTIRRQLNIVG